MPPPPSCPTQHHPAPAHQPTPIATSRAGYATAYGGSVLFTAPAPGVAEEGTYGLSTELLSVTDGAWGDDFTAVAWCVPWCRGEGGRSEACWVRAGRVSGGRRERCGTSCCCRPLRPLLPPHGAPSMPLPPCPRYKPAGSADPDAVLLQASQGAGRTAAAAAAIAAPIAAAPAPPSSAAAAACLLLQPLYDVTRACPTLGP